MSVTAIATINHETLLEKLVSIIWDFEELETQGDMAVEDMATYVLGSLEKALERYIGYGLKSLGPKALRQLTVRALKGEFKEVADEIRRHRDGVC